MIVEIHYIVIVDLNLKTFLHRLMVVSALASGRVIFTD